MQMFFSVFTIHGFLFFLLYFLYRFFEQNQEYQFMGFREKILLYFFSALLVLLALVFTFLYSGITRQFKTHVYQLMHEHFQTLKKSIAPVIPDDLDFQYVKDPLDFAIKKFSFENNADVIFYDTLGTQRLTTLEKLNSWGIRGYMLSASLLKVLDEKKFAKIILEEKAGKLSYPCLYGPVYNSTGKKAGYVAMPFFPSRMEIYRQTDILLNSAVNMFIIFTLSALLLTYLLSGYLLRPLRLMASRLRSDKPVWETEPLEWKSEDEIRQLVDAYNAMLLQLKENIKKLSEQERESAWREMARQIAHEIKNPLTPIKLSIQHLMYLYRQNPEQFEKKFPESSKAIIQQIDALAAIASEFSHFARISHEPFAPTDLKECIESVIRLYENSFLQIKTHFPDTPLIINGNKNQIIAVFNNLMENARQAMENQNNPEVTIDVSVTSDSLEVLFMDNGPGIPEEIREKLFMPYFTTKSSGSGLGLAIVQRIVQHHNGSIELIPSEKGACFRIKFPFNKNSQ
jgi:signal transduction histidine kinase